MAVIRCNKKYIYVVLSPIRLIPLAFTRTKYVTRSRSREISFQLVIHTKQRHYHSQTTIKENKTAQDTIKEVVNETADRPNQRVHTHLWHTTHSGGLASKQETRL